MNETRRLHPISLSLNEETHALSYATMQLPPGEEIPFHAWVRIYTQAGSAGVYRANKVDSDSETGCQTVKLEHGICALADAVANVDQEDVTGTAAQLLTRILQYQRTQAGGAALWAVGTVEPTDANLTVTLNYGTCMAAFTNLLDQLNECFPEYDQSSLPWTVSIRQKASSPQAEGRIGRNVTSAKIIYDDRDMANYVFCPKVSGGYVSDAASIAQYGRRDGYCKVDDNATAAQAADVAARYLAKRKDPQVSVSVSMADLSAVTGEPLDRIRCGKLFRLALPKYGVTVDQTVSAIAWPDLVSRPAEARVTLANHAADLVLKLKNMGKGGGGTKKELEKAIKRFSTSITQTDEYIRLIATETDVATAQQLGKSLFQINATSISAEVTRATGEEAAIRLELGTIEITATNEIHIKGSVIRMGDYVTVTNLQANYATITQLDAVDGKIDDLMLGRATASSIKTTLLQVGGTQYSNVPLRIGNIISAGGFLGTASSGVNLDHSHAITCSVNGNTVTITIGMATLTSRSDDFVIPTAS